MISPLCLLPLYQKQKHTKAKFTREEDKKLTEICMNQKVKDWNLIAKFFFGRNARQVRERWENYLSPDVNNGPWSEEEDKILLQKYAEVGSKWSFISRYLPRRTNTSCKNRWIQIERVKKRTEIFSNALKTTPPGMEQLPVEAGTLQNSSIADFDVENSTINYEEEAIDAFLDADCAIPIISSLW